MLRCALYQHRLAGVETIPFIIGEIFPAERFGVEQAVILEGIVDTSAFGTDLNGGGILIPLVGDQSFEFY